MLDNMASYNDGGARLGTILGLGLCLGLGECPFDREKDEIIQPCKHSPIGETRAHDEK